MNISLRHLAALAVLALGAASFAGCAAEPQPDPTEADSDENVGEAEEAVATCCQEGVLRCASNGYIVEYGQPGCGLPTHTIAISTCKSHCGGVSCVDSGWTNVCF